MFRGDFFSVSAGGGDFSALRFDDEEVNAEEGRDLSFSGEELSLSKDGEILGIFPEDAEGCR